MPRREVGIVRWYNSAEGYGFIARRRGEDVYVHYSAVRCDDGDCALEEGDPVEFVIAEGQNGPQAQEVTVKKYVK